MHPRKRIRDAVVATLKERTSAGTRVDTTRLDPYPRNELPGISVYTPDEQVDPNVESAPRELLRVVRVAIAGFVAGSRSFPLDDAMDALAEEIEVAMDGDRFLSGAAYDAVLESTDMATLGEGDPRIGIVTLTYSVEYHTTPAAGTEDDFQRAGATTQMPGAPAANAPTDLITVQETP